MYFTAEDRGSSSRGNRAEGITQLENTEITDRKIYRQLRFQCWLASNFESNLYFYDMCPILYVQKSDHWWVQCKKGMSFLCSIEKAVNKAFDGRYFLFSRFFFKLSEVSAIYILSVLTYCCSLINIVIHATYLLAFSLFSCFSLPQKSIQTVSHLNILWNVRLSMYFITQSYYYVFYHYESQCCHISIFSL